MQYEEVKELIAIFEKTDLNDMEVQLDNARVRLSRGGAAWVQTSGVIPAQPAAPAMLSGQPAAQALPISAATADKTEEVLQEPAGADSLGTKVIKAPIVGTFYQSSAPDEEPFVKVGDAVSEGQVVCIIEAMKFMNEVNSEVSGTITEVLVKDGDFVEYGQELFRVK